MATHPIDTATLFALTAAGPCSVTIENETQSITWQALSAGGQTTFIVPARSTVSISDPKALLSRLPFKSALGTSTGSAGGSPILPAGEKINTVVAEGSAATVLMQHGVWQKLPPQIESCRITPDNQAELALCTQLLLTPEADLPGGWLSTSDEATVTWLYGEPMISSGYSYIVTVVQISPTHLLANLAAIF